ncbi:hypothetical protein GCM10022631_01890 [Deinococcus rubellus]|uniref:DNA methylase N-4/N-6 domain-containing protein n=1 Tax=Deinococcus rubellus TaxID=1889240 RepID=A0ABY5YI35_9DEIO|nr:hypothetical protein [Deinococcus rubellus]UWX64770.1 hypothetical protein N0D28_03665 [Deinococcus rubellus]
MALKILLVDNRTAELGQRDEEAVAALLQEMLGSGDGLIGTGYDAGDLDQLLASLQGDAPPLVDDEEPASATELEVAQEKWTVQPGDIWEISSSSVPGRSHRVLCGDGLVPGALESLLQGAQPDVIHCDPPYGISIVNTGGQIGSGQVYRPVIGDDSTNTAVRAYQLTAERFPKALHVWWGGNYYADHLPPSMGWLVWDKQNDGLSFADVELAWTNQHRAARMFRHMWSGGARASETDERRTVGSFTTRPAPLPGLAALPRGCGANWFPRAGQRGSRKPACRHPGRRPTAAACAAGHPVLETFRGARASNRRQTG